MSCIECTIYIVSCNFYNSFDVSNNTQSVEIGWVASGHSNSKTKFQGHLQNTLFFHSVKISYSKCWKSKKLYACFSWNFKNLRWLCNLFLRSIILFVWIIWCLISKWYQFLTYLCLIVVPMCRPTHLSCWRKWKPCHLQPKVVMRRKNCTIFLIYWKHFMNIKCNNQSIHCQIFFILAYYQVENSILGKIMVRSSLFLTFWKIHIL
jgi:hypothetical protein